MRATFQIGFAASDTMQQVVGISAHDLCRIVRDDRAWIAGVANAYDTGWSVCWPPGSSTFLDRVESHWRGLEPSAGRLRTALERAADDFRRDAGSLAPADLDDDLSGRPAATTTFVDSEGHVVWIGGGTAFHVRDTVIAQSSPHTLARQVADAGEGPHAGIPDVITRSIAVDQSGEFEAATFSLEAGDKVVVLASRPPIGAEPLDTFEPRPLADKLASRGDNGFAVVIVIELNEYESGK